MTMYELTAIVWRRRTLALGLAAAVFVVGLIVVLATRSTTYTASSEVLFDQPGLVVAEGGSDVPTKIDDLLPTFCREVASNQVAEAAAAAAGVPTGVAASVRCSPEASTLIVLLQYSGGNAGEARAVVASVSTQLVDFVKGQFDAASVAPQLRLTANVIQESHVSRNSNGTTRALGLVAIVAVIIALAFTLAAEPHRQDWPSPQPSSPDHTAAVSPVSE